MIERLKAPEKGNPYYNTRSNDGYSYNIIGNANPRGGTRRKGLDGMNVLPNCVGWASGRFNEIIGQWLYTFRGNAEDYYACAKKLGLEIGSEPRVGGMMVWRKGKAGVGSDGYGHVVIVERKINDDEVLVSESGWSYTGGAMWTAIHKRGDGNWREGGDAKWMNSDYIYLGCIYNPAIKNYEPFELNILAYGNNVIPVNAICPAGENYVKLRDVETELHLCGVTWLNGGVMINGKPFNLSTVAIIQLDGTNYIRLRDLDTKLGLCKVSYDKTHKMPTITV